MTGFEMLTGLPDETRMTMGGASYLGIGPKGEDGKSAYESAQDGGYTRTEAQFNSDLAAVSEKYSKPTSGIPKTDLASGVQSSLEKADSALLSVPDTYRTAATQDTIDAGKLSIAAQEEKSSDMTQPVGVDEDGKLWVPPGGGGGGGTTDHRQLTNRDAAAQHPIGAITGLQSALDAKGTYSKPSDGIPKTDLAAAVQTSLALADSALQEVPAGYATETYVRNHHDTTKQNVIYDLATIRNGAARGALALLSVPDTYRTAAEQDTLDAGKLSTSGGTLRGDLTLDNGAKLTMNTGSSVFDGNGRFIFGESTGTMIVGVWDHLLSLRGSGRPTFNNNDLAFLSDVSGKADKPTVKSTMDAVAAVNTQYYLGTQSAVSIVLPTNAQVGQQITAVWYNGATAATLSVTGTVLDVDYTPSANSRSEINALWDGTYWAVVTNEQAVTA